MESKFKAMQGRNNIYIIGAGAIGKSLAVFLKNAGREIVILRGSTDSIADQTAHLQVDTENGVEEADILISTLSAFKALNGIVVLANKSYGNKQLAEMLKDKIGSSPIILLQNGLGIEQPFIRDEFSEVYRAVLFVTSQSISENYLRFKPVLISPIGVEKGDMQQLVSIVGQLDTPLFRFRSEEHIHKIIWKKAIVNCVFNSICPLLEVDNGIFHRNSNALNIARRIIKECILIAADCGILIQATEVEESLLQISKSSDGQLISTYQDILQKRRTEIDTLNFEFLRIAEKFQKTEAVQETRLLGELTKLKAEIHLERN